MAKPAASKRCRMMSRRLMRFESAGRADRSRSTARSSYRAAQERSHRQDYYGGDRPRKERVQRLPVRSFDLSPDELVDYVPERQIGHREASYTTGYSNQSYYVANRNPKSCRDGPNDAASQAAKDSPSHTANEKEKHPGDHIVAFSEWIERHVGAQLALVARRRRQRSLSKSRLFVDSEYRPRGVFHHFNFASSPDVCEAHLKSGIEAAILVLH